MANMFAGLYSVAVCWDFPSAFSKQPCRTMVDTAICMNMIEPHKERIKERERENEICTNSGTGYKIIIRNTKHHKSSASSILHPSLSHPCTKHTVFFFSHFIFISLVSPPHLHSPSLSFLFQLVDWGGGRGWWSYEFFLLLIFWIHIYTYNSDPTWLSWRLAW